MFHALSTRRVLVPFVVCLAIVALYWSCRSSISIKSLIPPLATSEAPPEVRLPFSEIDIFSFGDEQKNHVSPDLRSYLNTHSQAWSGNTTTSPDLTTLSRCLHQPNPHTNHIRIPYIVQNVSQVPPGSSTTGLSKFNPTIISLPYWSKNQYLLVSRVVTEGLHQENHMCEANTCYAGSAGGRRVGEVNCTEDDISVLGPAGGLRCAHEPILLNAPPTPAEQCDGEWENIALLPGFHDPRAFWSGKGEPLIIMNTHSRYTCFGLWIMDLRALYPPLKTLLTSSPHKPSLGPLISYATMTELTRNPPETRGPIEKNWMLFFPTGGSAYLHYDLSPTKRTFAKLIGNGYTTPNLTDTLELPCLTDDLDPLGEKGTWHQATNSLRLVLCRRGDGCEGTEDNTVFFAIVHRKFSNVLKLPLRYERFFIVWSASPPFGMLAISKDPILMYNETASGWTGPQNWADDPLRERSFSTNKTQHGYNGTTAEAKQDNWAYFTYTPSIAWAWGRARKGRFVKEELMEKNTGYLDDEVVLGIGLDDKAQVFGRAPAEVLLQCMRACPGRAAGQWSSNSTEV